ncbi:tetratricopeptide repeat protein [Lentzea sp. NPDC005914]|uniref:ATP-binding protein n=1 Tax=Lentzea sp. NPDC005914 TaxID=3154572 RepID=UPI0033E722E7
MTGHDQRDGTGSADETGRPVEADGIAVRNTVTGVVSGVAVQAHTITGGVHHHSAAPQRPVPRQLPAAPAAFVGREAELAELTAALNRSPDASGTVVISALAGTGGIGKTWLVLHWAHAHLDRFPDGQLFVDLRGFSPAGQPMETPAAVRGFLDGLDIDPTRIPTDLHAQAALYRSLVAGRRMLIVLDNAAAADQITPLLPGDPSCMVLVTSRRRLTSLIANHGAHSLRLDVLADVEARDLLTTRIGHGRVAAEPDAVSDLLAYCGKFPLALAIVAGRACSAPRMPLAALAAELRDEATRLDVFDNDDPAASLPAVLSWSVRALTPEQREVFGLLGIAPGPDIGLSAAASLTALPLARARRVLGGLEEASLLDHDGHGRWRMHDLVRAYATAVAHELDKQVREAALRRVLDFYTHTAHAADRLLRPHRDSIRLDPPAPGTHPQLPSDAATALAWFDTEYPTLLAAQHSAITQAWHSTTWQLAWTLDSFRARRGHVHDRLAAWRAALDAAVHLPDPTVHICAHRLLGLAHADLDHHEEATGHLDQSLALADSQHDLLQQAHIHQVLALAWGRRGDDQRALAHATRAMHLYRDLGAPVWEAEALSAASWHAARLGDYGTARAHCQAALIFHRRHHNSDFEAATLDSLGWIEHHTGHHAQAIDHYRQALGMFRDIGNNYQVAITLNNLGHPHLALGHTEQARAVWLEALRLYQNQGRHDEAAQVQRQLDDLDPRDDGDQPPPAAESAK